MFEAPLVQNVRHRGKEITGFWPKGLKFGEQWQETLWGEWGATASENDVRRAWSGEIEGRITCQPEFGCARIHPVISIRVPPKVPIGAGSGNDVLEKGNCQFQGRTTSENVTT
eukprot:1005007-Rhodomonas_salina.1